MFADDLALVHLLAAADEQRAAIGRLDASLYAHIRTVPGVQSVISLPAMAKIVNAGYSKGSLKWRVLPRNQLLASSAEMNLLALPPDRGTASETALR